MKWRNRRREEIATIRFWRQWNVDRSTTVMFIGNTVFIPRKLLEYMNEKFPARERQLSNPFSMIGYKIIPMGPEHASQLPNRRARKNAKWRAKIKAREESEKEENLIMPMAWPPPKPVMVDDMFSPFRLPLKYLEGERSTYLEEKHRDSKLYRNYLFGGFGNI